MVIDGSLIDNEDLAVAKLDGDRINLPIRFVKLAGLDTDEAKRIDRTLLVVCPGRYRLLTKASQDLQEVREIRSAMEEIAATGGVFEETETNVPSSIRVRLIPCTITRPEPSWRMIVPKVAILLAPGERSHIFLLIVRGYVELWFPDVLRQAMSKPLVELLS